MPDAPPDTTAYLLLGLAVTFVIMLGLVGSMLARWRNLQRDRETLEKLDED